MLPNLQDKRIYLSGPNGGGNPQRGTTSQPFKRGPPVFNLKKGPSRYKFDINAKPNFNDEIGYNNVEDHHERNIKEMYTDHFPNNMRPRIDLHEEDTIVPKRRGKMYDPQYDQDLVAEFLAAYGGDNTLGVPLKSITT